VAVALLGHGVLWGHRVAFGARLELDGRGESLGRIADPQMVWIAAGMADAQISGKVMLQIHAVRDRPLADLIKDTVGLQLLVVGVHSAVSVGASISPELPTIGVRPNQNLVEQLLHGEFHMQQNTPFKKLLVRLGWRGVTFGVTFLSYLVRYGALKCHFSTEMELKSSRYSGLDYPFIH
jgi:hypothetical protein